MRVRCNNFVNFKYFLVLGLVLAIWKFLVYKLEILCNSMVLSEMNKLGIVKMVYPLGCHSI